jgi:hypothetical protein
MRTDGGTPIPLMPTPLRRVALALLLAALGLAPGCGRALRQSRDGQAPAGDGAADGNGGTGDDRDGAAPDGTLPGDAPADNGGFDRAADLVGDRPAPDAPPDRPMDLGPTPDLGGPPEAGQDQAADRRIEGAPDADVSCGSLSDIRHCGSCDHDCTALPNVAVDWLYCNSGTCKAYQCVEGFAQCPTVTANHGCETDLRSDPKNCGACGRSLRRANHGRQHVVRQPRHR